MPIWNRKYERMSRGETEQLQLERLQATINRVYRNVPFYHRKLQQLNIAPEDVQTLADVKKLPLTTKNDLRDGYPYEMFAVPLREPDGLARPVAQEIQLGATNLAAAGRHDIQHVGRMERELPLDALVRDDPPDNEALVDASTLTGDHRAGEDLCPGLVAFLDAAMHVHRITHFEMGDLFLQTLTFDSIQQLSFHE